MRDTKSLMLLLVSLLLVLVSFVLIWTWGYSYYTKNENVRPVTILPAPDAASIANQVRDSLQNVYNATLKDLDMQLDSTLYKTDSLKTELDLKLAEFYRLRNEIALILKNRNTNNNFTVAKQKISELQVKAEDLKKKNDDVESENKKLNEVLNQIKEPEKNVESKIKPFSTATAKNTVAEKTSPAYQLFTASDLKLAAIKSSGDTDSETTEAGKADKFSGSFSVMNFNSQVSNAEIMVVILKPDGRVLKYSAWDSGTFTTPDGKKIYTYKLSFNYSKGESRRLSFSVRTGTLINGSYTMEVYYNGLLIGRTSKTLS